MSTRPKPLTARDVSHVLALLADGPETWLGYAGDPECLWPLTQPHQRLPERMRDLIAYFALVTLKTAKPYQREILEAVLYSLGHHDCIDDPARAEEKLVEFSKSNWVFTSADLLFLSTRKASDRLEDNCFDHGFSNYYHSKMAV